MRMHHRFLITFACLVGLAGPVAAACGDGVLEPSEQCDLGVANCQPGLCCETSCDSACQLVGRCTGSQACCTTDAECPVGEGCCGNLALEASEQCDDGNRIENDCCSTSCQIEPSPCVPLPPECGTLGPLNVLGNPSIRRVIMRDSRPVDGQFDLFGRDRFVLPDGLDIDPDTEIVSFLLTQNDGNNGTTELYRGVLDPAQCPGAQCFAVRTNRNGLDKKWEFRDMSVAGAPGWTLSRMTRNLGFPSQITEAYKMLDTSIAEPVQVSGRRRVRQSVVVGDICVTRLLDCERNNRRTRYTCREIHCGDGLKQRAEQCGEPGLACRGTRVCDSCRCMRATPFP